jgi:predicted MFS family arabinose efflux permease
MTTNNEAMQKPAWTAIFANTLVGTVLTTSELLPVSILTPMAEDLNITEGAAGQMVTATSVVGFVSSLLVAFLARNLNRRVLLLLLSGLILASNLIVALAPNFSTLLIGRLLLGTVVAGFWAFSASVTMRLVPATLIPAAFSVLYGGVALSRIIAGPLATYFEPTIGWRNIFLVVAFLALLALLWQFFTLPSLPTKGRARLITLLHLLARPQVRLGMISILLAFVGTFVAFTYFRPFLEVVTGASVNEISAIFFWFGIAAFVGSSLAGTMLRRNLSLTVILIPLSMALIAIGLVVFGKVPLLTSVLVALWGFASSLIPVGWNTWITRTLFEEAESAGGLLVASIQLGIALGAAIGGISFDRTGAAGTFVVAACVLLLCTFVTVLAMRFQANRAEIYHKGIEIK